MHPDPTPHRLPEPGRVPGPQRESTAHQAGLPRGLTALVLSGLLSFIHLGFIKELPQPWPLWPAAAVAFAFAWRHGLVWGIPAVLGALPVAAIESATALDLLALLIGVTLGPLLAVIVLRRQERWHPSQSSTQSSLRFIAVISTISAPAIMLSSVLLGRVATIGLPTSRIAAFPFGLPALGMWLSGTALLLILIPALLALLDAQPHGEESSSADGAPWFDLSGLAVTFVLTLGILSIGLSDLYRLSQYVLFGVFPIMLWSALRNEGRSHALMLFLIGAPALGAAFHVTRQHVVNPVELLWIGSMSCLVLACAAACATVAHALVTDRRQALEASRRLGREDADTGLLNDRGLISEMQNLLSQQQRPALGLIGLQIGNLSALRELCGPIEAARMEARIAGVMRELLATPVARSNRVAARWTAERFLMMLPSQSISELRALGRELYSRLSGETFTGPHDSISLRISVGGILIEPGALVQAEEGLAALEDAIGIAASVNDPQLFVEPLSPSMLAARRAQQDRTEQLRDAIREGRLELYAQPVIDPDAPAGMLAYEVLTRVKDREGALFQPAEFMPLAVKAQLLAKLDRAVIRKIFEWLATHPRALERTWRCAINLAGPSLDDPGLPAFIREMRIAFDISPQKIVFEITESAAIRHAAEAARLVDELKSEGFGIALDDFGTGLATFEYLKRFPLDYLKIDGSFIRNLTHDELDEEIVLSTLRVASKLNLRAVAEHVHSEEVRQRLQTLGVRYLQGDLFGRAAPIDTLFTSGSIASSGSTR